MMIWLFAFQMGWFPLGKFLDPLLWREAHVSADYVFNRMLLTGGAFMGFVMLVMLASRWTERSGFRARFLPGLPVLTWWVPAVLVGALVAVVAWSFSGVGHLAWDIVKHMVLPIFTLTSISFAGTMLLTRNSMLETLREDFVTAARAKGLPERAVRDKHAARNALLPVVTSLVYSLAFAIDGSVIIESIFSWPGLGLTLLQAVRGQDLPLVMAAFVFIGIFALTAHLVADLLYAYLDPRIRYS